MQSAIHAIFDQNEKTLSDLGGRPCFRAVLAPAAEQLFKRIFQQFVQRFLEQLEFEFNLLGEYLPRPVPRLLARPPQARRPRVKAVRAGIQTAIRVARSPDGNHRQDSPTSE